MRKLIWIVIAMFMVSFISCSKCSKKETLVDTVKAELIVENAISTDKEFMFVNYGKDYKFFESCILMKNYLDNDSTGEIAGISNVFQVVEEKEQGADTHVVLAAHTPDTTTYEVKHGFWVEDFDLSNEEIKVTFKEAFEKINQVNLPKPHSKQCVLRKEIGPKACNPQYIFGNVKAQIYVDAVTGDVTDVNPAFPEEK